MKITTLFSHRFRDIVISVGFYIVLYRLFFNVISLPQEAYFQPTFAFHLLLNPIFLVFSFLVITLAFLNIRSNSFVFQRLNWQSMEHGTAIRYLIFFICLILAWKYSTYSFNFYLNQSHLLERVLLLVLAGGVLLNPLFVPIFVIFSITIIKQLAVPANLFMYSWTDKSLVFAVLTMFTAYLLTRAFTGARSTTLIYLLICVIAGYYFTPGLAKLRMGDYAWQWLLNNRLDYLWVNSYANGWLSFLDESTILSIAHIIKILNFPLQIFTLVVEVGAIFMLVNRRITIIGLCGFILLHIGIFLSSGIFFWKWILLDAAVLIFLWTRKDDWLNGIYKPGMIFLSFLLILFSRYIFQAVPLGWLDSGVNRTYIIEVETADGEAYQIAPDFMAPYDIVFSQERFYFLNNENILVNTYGTIFSYEVHDALHDILSVGDFDRIKDAYGYNQYNPERIKAFDAFMRQFFDNLNQNQRTNRNPILLPSAFSHIITMAENRYAFQSPVTQINIYNRLSLYHDQQIEYGPTNHVYSIPLDGDEN